MSGDGDIEEHILHGVLKDRGFNLDNAEGVPVDAQPEDLCNKKLLFVPILLLLQTPQGLQFFAPVLHLVVYTVSKHMLHATEYCTIPLVTRSFKNDT